MTEKDKHNLEIQLSVLKVRLEEVNQQVEMERERYKKSMELSEMEKDEIIMLRKKIQGLEDKVMKYVERSEEASKLVEKLKAQKFALTSQIQSLKAENV